MQIQMELEEFPSRLAWNRPLSDEQFERICEANSVMQLERTKEGEIIVNPPTGGFTSQGNSEITKQLSVWNDLHLNGSVYDSNGGFYLPDGSMLCPDAAYVRKTRLKGLTREERRKLLRLCPDFIIELLSSSDQLSAVQAKMESWILNGVALGWLIEPERKIVHVYEPEKPTRIEAGTRVAGTGPVDGFVLDLAKLWRWYEPEL